MNTPCEFSEPPFALVIHGGAGILRNELSVEREAASRRVLEYALLKGFQILRGGGSSLDTVCAAIEVLEDSPLFNAGCGSVLTSSGTVEMDAAVMEGSRLKAGAVAGVHGVRNPIRLAREVMEHSPHVLLIGEGARAFAKERNIPFEPDQYFITAERTEQRQVSVEPSRGGNCENQAPSKMGTVGAVALDKQGHLSAGTSTGGTINKRVGRVGDSPIIGAGTYAEDRVVAVSCTGHGEFFIRAVVAYDVAARMKYQGASVSQATHQVVNVLLPELGGAGGLISIDSKGNVAMPFNTQGMFRGFIKSDAIPHISIFEESNSG